LDSSSNELAASILTPLTEPQRDRLITAMADVERLILASQVRVEIIDPRDITRLSPPALHILVKRRGAWIRIWSGPIVSPPAA